MVEPPWIGRAALLVVGMAVALPSAGCSFVPTSRLDDCHKLSQTLQSENSRLKDLALKYRSQNRDLTQRAVDDADRLRKQDEAIARLEQSVQAYQDEREQMAAALERIKGQVQASADPRRAPLFERVKAFARAHPGCEFDPETAATSFPIDGLFEPKSDRLKPEARDLLKAYAETLTGPEARDLGLEVAGPADGPPVHRAGLERDLDGPRSRHLSLARTTRVRDLLAAEARIDASRIRVAGGGFEAHAGAGRADAPRRIEIRLRRDDEDAPVRVGAGTPAAAGPGRRTRIDP
jgi:chemotaxis protein MotB